MLGYRPPLVSESDPCRGWASWSQSSPTHDASENEQTGSDSEHSQTGSSTLTYPRLHCTATALPWAALGDSGWPFQIVPTVQVRAAHWIPPGWVSEMNAIEKALGVSLCAMSYAGTAHLWFEKAMG